MGHRKSRVSSRGEHTLTCTKRVRFVHVGVSWSLLMGSLKMLEVNEACDGSQYTPWTLEMSPRVLVSRAWACAGRRRACQSFSRQEMGSTAASLHPRRSKRATGARFVAPKVQAGRQRM
jgi:hypothetical protein